MDNNPPPALARLIEALKRNDLIKRMMVGLIQSEQKAGYHLLLLLDDEERPNSEVHYRIVSKSWVTETLAQDPRIDEVLQKFDGTLTREIGAKVGTFIMVLCVEGAIAQVSFLKLS